MDFQKDKVYVPPVVEKETTKYLEDNDVFLSWFYGNIIMGSADKGNKGKPRRSAFSAVARLKPEITLTQAASHYDNTLLPKAKKDAVLSGVVSAQTTTSMRPIPACDT